MSQIPIIDTHIHLFSLSDLPNLAWQTPDGPLSYPHPHGIYASSIPPSLRSLHSGFIFIETDRKYNVPSTLSPEATSKAWSHVLSEFAYAASLSEASPPVLGIIPWGPLDLGVEAMETYYSLLDKKAIEKGLLKGFRYLLQDKLSGTISKKDFVESLKWIRRKGLIFELGVDVHRAGIQQLEEAVQIAEEVFSDPAGGTGGWVVNHLAKPPLHLGAKSPGFKAWRENIAHLAAYPNVAIKLSGVFSELPAISSTGKPGILSEQARDDVLRLTKPYILSVFEEFGADRVVWGSDWPVCNVGYDEMAGRENDFSGAWNSWRELAARVMEDMGLGAKERAAVWGENARRVYNI
ncbi:hypothetical protein RUND412_006027 [Rhizina undulata]